MPRVLKIAEPCGHRLVSQHLPRGAIMQDWVLVPERHCLIKSNPTPNFRGVAVTNAHETLLWRRSERARNTLHHYAMKALNDDLQMRSDWQIPVCSGKERLRVHGAKAHPTQKPEALLVSRHSGKLEHGDLVLDPFFGRDDGSCGRSCNAAGSGSNASQATQHLPGNG